MGILIGADFVPTNSNIEKFKNGEMRELIGEGLFSRIQKADYRIFNLEMPIANSSDPISKWGKNLIADIESINGYTALKTDLLTLANNHILDQGESGLKTTIRILEQNGIQYMGAGKSIVEAQRPYVLNFNGKKVGIYNCTEHEFSIATDNAYGANPFDYLLSFEHVNTLKKSCEYVIVLYHGGKEYYRYPSLELQKTCRHFVDSGADLIICQHSHCIGSLENYKKGIILYGQGNFIFDDGSNEFLDTGLLVEINNDFSISYIPYEKYKSGIRECSSKRKAEIMNDLQNRSKLLSSKSNLLKKYSELSDSWYEIYLSILTTKRRSLFIRLIRRFLGKRIANKVLNNCYKMDDLLAVKNIIECEAHRELLLFSINKRIDELERYKK